MAEELNHVFIATSFATGCRERAQRLVDFLGYFGVRCIFGEGFGGGPISAGVQAGITSSSFVIALLSRENKIGDGAWEPSQWVIQEVTWAHARMKTCLLLVEEGVRFSGGMLGDVEYISFDADGFSDVFPHVLRQVKVILKKEGLTIGVKEDDPIQIYLRRVEGENDSPEALHEKVLTLVGREKYEEALELAEKLTKTHPNYWRGWITLGAVLVKLWNLDEGDAVFVKMLEDFSSDDEACGAALHNHAWVIELKSKPHPSARSLNEQACLYRKALARDTTRVYTRASLICIYVLLDQVEKAHALLNESAIYGEGFLEAMRRELDTRGVTRFRIISQLPTLAQNLLYPIRRNHAWQPHRHVVEAINQLEGLFL